jgi:hypothetical protein
MGDDRILLTLKTPWADGTRHLIFAPLELLEKLAALTPRPRINLILYHRALAPNARWRARVVAYGALPATAATAPNAGDDSADDAASPVPPRHWACSSSKLNRLSSEATSRLAFPRTFGSMSVRPAMKRRAVSRCVLS